MAQFKKSDVSDFMEKRIYGLIAEENKAIRTIAEEFKPFIAEHYSANFEKINKEANALYDKVLAYSSTHHLATVGNFSNDMRAVNAVMNWDKTIARDYGANLIQNIFDDVEVRATSRNMLKRVPKFDEWLAGALSRVKAHKEKISNLRNLLLEVKRVIRGATSGKNAYQDLIVLGVDMSDFKPVANPQLPAIQKFSVDPCIINAGGCK